MLLEVAGQADKQSKAVSRHRSIMNIPATKKIGQVPMTPIGQCSRGIQALPREQAESSPNIWRPWILTPRDVIQKSYQEQNRSADGHRSSLSTENSGFQHPVRLYLPKSKCHEYLHSTGEKILASFPVQATINFYNDNSDSADDEEEEEEERNETL